MVAEGMCEMQAIHRIRSGIVSNSSGRDCFWESSEATGTTDRPFGAETVPVDQRRASEVTENDEETVTVPDADSSDWALDVAPVSYTHLRAHETVLDLVCRLLLEKKKQNEERRRTRSIRRKL
eukprot:TRINITY_DN11953_c0_g1_i1.p2 TRINITY_DN11953_c0_g1~~TRINITY_DN11953_c0_g1_i1.p2  ORF type:complete len:123 (+),score=15.39 TRINITY_DN11953_c0_g1_i1:477-845(+)